MQRTLHHNRIHLRGIPEACFVIKLLETLDSTHERRQLLKRALSTVLHRKTLYGAVSASSILSQYAWHGRHRSSFLTSALKLRSLHRRRARVPFMRSVRSSSSDGGKVLRKARGIPVVPSLCLARFEWHKRCPILSGQFSERSCHVERSFVWTCYGWAFPSAFKWLSGGQVHSL